MFKPKASNINIIAIIPTTAAFLFVVMDIIIKLRPEIKET